MYFRTNEGVSVLTHMTDTIIYISVEIKEDYEKANWENSI